MGYDQQDEFAVFFTNACVNSAQVTSCIIDPNVYLFSFPIKAAIESTKVAMASTKH